MLKDPIVARKSRNRFIISAVKDTDPIQLIRQLSDQELEVHLKNGTTYIEHVTPDELDLIILELMGYREETLVLSFCAWPDAQNRRLEFEIEEVHHEYIGNDILDQIFEETPFIKSKFISLSVSANEEIREFYGQKYGIYDVKVELTFWCRADMTKEITAFANGENGQAYDMCRTICNIVGDHDRVLRNNIDVSFLSKD